MTNDVSNLEICLSRISACFTPPKSVVHKNESSNDFCEKNFWYRKDQSKVKLERKLGKHDSTNRLSICISWIVLNFYDLNCDYFENFDVRIIARSNFRAVKHKAEIRVRSQFKWNDERYEYKGWMIAT